jgi:hypothetical protein
MWPNATHQQLLCTTVWPDSSYSHLEMHISWTALSDDKREPTVQTEYLYSSGATTLIFIVEGAKVVNAVNLRLEFST